MKKTLFRVLVLSFFLVFLTSITTTVSANAGPPANIQLTVLHDGVEFEFDFLIEIPTPLSTAAINQARQKIDDAGDAMIYDFYYQETFPDALITFQDSERFVSNALYGSSRYFYHSDFHDDQDTFFLYFTTPLIFKAAIVIDDVIITSPLIEMTQFDFRLEWDIRGLDLTESQEGVGEVTGFVDHPLTQGSTYLHYFARLIFTLMVELSILFLFGFRKKITFIQVGILNFVTQSALTIGTLSLFFLSHQSAFFGVMILFIVGEMIVFLVETIFLVGFVKERGPLRRALFALFANSVSLAGGMVLMLWLFETIH